VGFDLVAQGEIGARVAGLGLGELVAEGGQGLGAPGAGGVEFSPGGLGRGVQGVDHLVGNGDGLAGRPPGADRGALEPRGQAYGGCRPGGKLRP
jgi:hypothetical protein